MTNKNILSVQEGRRSQFCGRFTLCSWTQNLCISIPEGLLSKNIPERKVVLSFSWEGFGGTTIDTATASRRLPLVGCPQQWVPAPRDVLRDAQERESG